MPDNDRSAQADANALSQHSWLSNPLDWSHIDRMIGLAVLILLSPTLISAALALLWFNRPDALNRLPAFCLLIINIVYALSLLILIACAFVKRQHHSHWIFFENYLIFSFMITIIFSGWLSGTQFTSGALLLMLGVFIASPLADIHRLKRAYALAFVLYVVMFFLAGFSLLPQAPLLAISPYFPDGTPQRFWTMFQTSVVAVIILVLYLGLLFTQRWGNRENLYREMSTIDGLTRLANRRSFMTRGENEFLRAERSPNSRLSCIMVDIDHFKQINDTAGHQAGDAVLRQISDILLKGGRQYDEAGRYGGEEFVVLLPNTPLANAAQVAERLRKQIEASTVECDGEILQVTASFGVASYPNKKVSDFDGLLKEADKALYAAKQNGRNQVVTADKVTT